MYILFGWQMHSRFSLWALFDQEKKAKKFLQPIANDAFNQLKIVNKLHVTCMIKARECENLLLAFVWFLIGQ